jgi:hypothetical protein
MVIPNADRRPNIHGWFFMPRGSSRDPNNRPHRISGARIVRKSCHHYHGDQMSSSPGLPLNLQRAFTRIQSA